MRRPLPLFLALALALPGAPAGAQDQSGEPDQEVPAADAAEPGEADDGTSGDIGPGEATGSGEEVDADESTGTGEGTGPDDDTGAQDPSAVPVEEIRRFVALYNAVKQAYVEPVEDRDLMQSAVRGLLLDLDPHSAYLAGDAADAFDEQTRGNYGGLGVEILRQPDGTLRVIAPFDDTPAARAGILAGDVIVAVDGISLTPSLSEDAVPLRGEPGTTVRLTVLREGEPAPLEMTVEREVIRLASVRGRMLDPGYGYVRVSAFQAGTAADFERVVGELQDEAGGSLDGLLIDLRSNPGGLLTSAVQIADALLDDGLIVSTRGRTAISDASFSATPGDLLDGAPVVVLVDAGSASASEVLAGALADHGRARVVGSRTFGKGSVQTVLPLDNGDSVKLTTALYYTPDGTSIQATGIVPAVEFDAAAGEEEQDAGEPSYPVQSEATLAGHLGGGDAEGAPGQVLTGDAYIDQALAELKELAAPAQVAQ